MKLYRYERPDTFRIDTLRRNEIWMANPQSFNDPFDCRLNILDHTEYSTFNLEDIKLAAQILYKHYNLAEGSWLITKEILDSIEDWISGDDITKGIAGKPNFLILIENRVSQFGINCFSETDFTSPLMWAHYAQNYQGFCIEYECNELELVCNNSGEFSIYPTTYSTNLPKFNLTELLFSPREVTERLLATKSEHWSYEREHRLVYFPPKPIGSEQGQSIKLPHGLKVSSIIAGLNSNGIKDILKTTAKELNIPFKKINYSYPSYNLKTE